MDAFADEPFSGNPAAVCVLDAPRDEQWMRSVAAEMNLSETAYLVPEGDAWRLRWAAKLGKDEKLAGEAVTVLRAELMVE